MMSKPSVNMIRWRSSVALPKALQLTLAAICSAAEAIWVSFHKKRRCGFPISGVWENLENYVSDRWVAHKVLLSRCRCCDSQ